jgi:hypothetical protein
MPARRSVAGRIIGHRWTAAAVLIGLTIGAGAVLADQRFSVPQQDPLGPFYARIEPGLIHHTDEWAAIAFYREPGCVPTDFNLLDFFDVPRAFGCPLTVHGFVVYKDFAPGMPPIQSKLQGNGAVPVWFVRWDELEAAVGDGMLTMTELREMNSLVKGTAMFFEETLHPTGGAQQTMLEIDAFGYLDGGRSFDYQATEVKGHLVNVRIAFR